jgi:hypothetical protein
MGLIGWSVWQQPKRPSARVEEGLLVEKQRAKMVKVVMVGLKERLRCFVDSRRSSFEGQKKIGIS